jgi:molybdenum cofactor synthesis domain-containing protein
VALAPLDETRAAILAAVPPLPPVDVALPDAVGLVLAADVVAGEPVPPFANTAMDGYAVRAADTEGASDDAPVRLRVVDELPAGRAPSIPVGDGEAIRIMTGAPMPHGADAVVMVERTQRDGDDGVLIGAVASAGDHVRRPGGDLEAGEVAFPAGTVLGPAHVGVLASIGAATVRVYRRARVGVLSTGDELVEAGQPLAPGQIRDSNRITLLSLVAESGCIGVDLGRIEDDEAAIAAAIEAGAGSCDALLTSGGVSMGDFDFVKVVLDRIGDMRWMQVSIRPAKPLAFGTVAGPGGSDGPDLVPVFGLPGNPVSSMVSFELFARPGLRLMMGHAADALDRPHVIAIADEPLARRPDGKIHLDRVVARYDEADASYHVRSAGKQGSHQLTAMATADALALVPDGDTVEVGERVRVMLLAPR